MAKSIGFIVMRKLATAVVAAVTMTAALWVTSKVSSSNAWPIVRNIFRPESSSWRHQSRNQYLSPVSSDRVATVRLCNAGTTRNRHSPSSRLRVGTDANGDGDGDGDDEAKDKAQEAPLDAPSIADATALTDGIMTTRTVSPTSGRNVGHCYRHGGTSSNGTGGLFDAGASASAAMVGLPLVSLAVFPWLLRAARSFPANSDGQLLVVTALFVANRACLYALAVTVVGLAATRGATDPVPLGRRVTQLTEELLFRPDFAAAAGAAAIMPGEDAETDASSSSPASRSPKMIESLRTSGVEESFDQLSSETQAILLPLLVSFLLALSVFFVPFMNDGDIGARFLLPDGSSIFGGAASLNVLLKEYWPLVSQIWNAGILTLFTRAEVRRLAHELLPPTSAAAGAAASASASASVLPAVLFEWTVAVGVAGVACFAPPLSSASAWPAQNFVNMALAVLVASLLQLDRLAPIVGALTLLTLYDATSVLLVPAAGAATELASSPSVGDGMLVASASSSVGGSAMGSVVVQKLLSATFQPGLLVTKIDDATLGGALGLGDAVFPSMLATFVRRFDVHMNCETPEQNNGNNDDTPSTGVSLFGASIAGYLLGCAACEFAPRLSTTGLPALVFIVPSMLGAVLISAYLSGNWGALWNYDASSPPAPPRMDD